MKLVSHRTCYLAVVLYVSGFVVLGAAFQQKLSIGAVIMGWGISVVAIMINTVAICECICRCAIVMAVLNSYVSDAYSNDCFPKRQVCSQYICRRVADGFGIG